MHVSDQGTKLGPLLRPGSISQDLVKELATLKVHNARHAVQAIYVVHMHVYSYTYKKMSLVKNTVPLQ